MINLLFGRINRHSDYFAVIMQTQADVHDSVVAKEVVDKEKESLEGIIKKYKVSPEDIEHILQWKHKTF